MIVIHAAIEDRDLLLWAEQRSPSDNQVFASLEAEEFWPVLSQQLHYDGKVEALKGCGNILLPSMGAKALLFFDDSNATASEAKAFPLSFLSFPPGQACTILAGLTSFRHKRLLAPGVVLGNEITALVDLICLAGRIVASQQFLPGMRYDESEKNYRAEWQAVFNSAELNYIAQMSTSMPGVTFAVARADGEKTKQAAAATDRVKTIRKFTGGLVDHIVRSATEHSGFEIPAKTKKIAAKRTVIRSAADKPSSAHESWLLALTGTNNIVDYDLDELKKFGRQLNEWQRPAISRTEAPFRLCFRLDEPPPLDANEKETLLELESFPHHNSYIEELKRRQAASDNGRWKVSYHLQSQTDQSLLIPAEKVWHGNKTEKQILAMNGFNAREHLLFSLGQAAKLFPELEQGLREKAPAAHEINNDSALDFLKEKALLLEDAGFGVLTPTWWTTGPPKLKAKAIVASPYMPTIPSLTLETIVSFDYVMAVGDHNLSYEELAAIAGLKSPLVKVRGEWLHLDPEHLAEVLKGWKKKSGTATLKDLLGVSIGARDNLGGILVNEIQAGGWVEQLLKTLQEPASIENLEPPAHLQATLRPYQLRGYSWLSFLKNWGMGACLADDMGLGKTIQTLAMIQNMRQSNEPRKPVLLICPTSVMNNWLREGERFTPNLKLIVHHGAGRASGEKFQNKAHKADIVISSYNLLFRDRDRFGSVDWDGIILDEAQNIKNAETRQARAARSIKADFRVALTGTPVENNVGDLWALMQFLNPGLLGEAKTFRKNFFYPIQVNNDENARTKLKRITQPFILRRMKTDKTIIKDLPDKQESKVFCQLTREQASLYEAVIQDMNDQLDRREIEVGAIILSGLSRLKQVCNHPAQVLKDNSSVAGRSGKLIRLLEIMQNIIDAREKVLIFSQFTTMHDLLKPFLEEQFGFPVLYLHGGTSRSDRTEMVDRFQTDPDCPIFLLSIKAGGTGLNLTAANHVIHFDRWWNPAVEDQATDRAFRIGQKKNVQVHKFVCTGTLEERIDKMIDSKQKIAGSVVGTGEAWLAQLSNQELRAAFALSKGAIIEP